MNIIEAVTCDRPFKRSTWNEFLTVDCGTVCWNQDRELYSLRHEDVLAWDWEVEEQKIVVTKDELVKYYHKAITADELWSLLRGDK